MIELWVVYSADILLLGRLLLYWLPSEVSSNTSALTHVTHIVLSHLYNITIGFNAVQWHSTQSPVAHQGYEGQRPYIYLDSPRDLLQFTPLLGVPFLQPPALIYSPRYLSVRKGILPYSLLETYSSSSLYSILNLLLLITEYAALLLKWIRFSHHNSQAVHV